MKHLALATAAVLLAAPLSAGERETMDGYQVFPNDPAEMQTILDTRDLHGGTQAYLWSMAISTMLAWEEANLKVADYMDVVLYVTADEKRDIITANVTTPYAVSYVDLSQTDGMVEIVVPSGPVGGVLNDGQMRGVVDIGLAGPDKGNGGTYLILGPGAEEPETHSADFVVRTSSNVLFTGFRVLVDDPEQRDALFAGYKLRKFGEESQTRVVSIGDTPYRGSNLRGMDHWKELHAYMQREVFGPTDAIVLQFLARLGIEQGKPFEPNERQKSILLEAEQLGFSMSVAMSAARELDDGLDGEFYAGTYWSNPLQVTGVYDHLSENGVMELDKRTSYSHEAITISESNVVEIVGVGQKYVAAYRDSSGAFLNSGFNYVLTVPADPPVEQFWALTGYNAATRAMVYTDTKEISSRMDLYVADDGATPVYMSSDCASMPHPQNCVNTSGQGDVFVYFRVYAPTEAFFDKSWTLPNIERIE